jgi:signal transduction histidine kinase
MVSLRQRVPLPVLGDVLLAALFELAAQVDVWVRGNVAGPRLENAVILAFVAPPLIWRRRWPSVTAALIGVVVGTQAIVVGHPPSGFLYWPILVGGYSLGAYAPVARRPLAAFAVLLAGYAVVAVQAMRESPFNGTEVPWMFAPVIAWLIGRFMSRRRERAAGVAESMRLERVQEQRRLLALEQERARMARELHDILAHSVSLMGVQAGAAEEVLGRDPERARPVLRSIQQTARDSVGELRRLLGMLRADDAESELTPQPNLHDLDALLQRMREAGLPVELRVERATQPVPPGVELTAYRVVQEALTNVLKHARPTRVEVALTYARGCLEVAVRNDGVATRGNGTGHGLIGMRERVSLYGGTLDAGIDREGAFRVCASIPLEALPS